MTQPDRMLTCTPIIAENIHVVTSPKTYQKDVSENWDYGMLLRVGFNFSDCWLSCYCNSTAQTPLTKFLREFLRLAFQNPRAVD